MKLAQQQLQQIHRIAEILKNMGCTFEIKTPEGHGFTNAKKPKATPVTDLLRKHGVNRGEITTYLKNILKDVKVGQVIDIPLGPYAFLGKMLGCYISGYCSGHFGKGAYSSTWDKDSQSFLVHVHGGI